MLFSRLRQDSSFGRLPTVEKFLVKKFIFPLEVFVGEGFGPYSKFGMNEIVIQIVISRLNSNN